MIKRQEQATLAKVTAELICITKKKKNEKNELRPTYTHVHTYISRGICVRVKGRHNALKYPTHVWPNNMQHLWHHLFYS